MALISTTKTKKFFTEESRTFTYPSRVSDLYNPSVETILDAREEFPSVELSVVAKDDSSYPKGRSGNPTLASKIKSFYSTSHNSKTISIGEGLIFDARYETYNNFSHLIHNVILPLLHIKNSILNSGYSSQSIIVVLGMDVKNYVLDAFRMLNFEVVVTDKIVKGHVVRLAQNFDHKLFSLIPELLNFKISDKEYKGPRKVFVPRRGHRSIVNQAEVSGMLSELGYETLYFEDLSVREEWEIAENVDSAIVVHGAAWSHFVWNKRGASFIDIKSPAFSLKLVGYLSAMVNARHCSVRGQITQSVIKGLDFSKVSKIGPHWAPFKDPTKIHVDSIARALDYINAD